MYGFVVCYDNMDTMEERTQLIEVDGQLFDSEKEIYLYAMGKAFDGTKTNECFAKLEFLYC